jgi:hypothetical protein
MFLWMGYTGIQFHVYDTCMKKCGSAAPNSATASLMSGSIAGFAATTTTYPLDIMRTVCAQHRASASNVHAHSMPLCPQTAPQLPASPSLKPRVCLLRRCRVCSSPCTGIPLHFYLSELCSKAFPPPLLTMCRIPPRPFFSVQPVCVALGAYPSHAGPADCPAILCQ